MAIKKETNYFDLFEKGSDYAYQCAVLLRDMLCNTEIIAENKARIKELEHEADLHAHHMLEQLHKSFITPLDRDDIYNIVLETDDITDSIEAVSGTMWMMHIHDSDEPMRKMAEYTVQSCEALVKMMHELKHFKRNNKIHQYIIEINDIEEFGDRCFKDAMRALYTPGTDPVVIITKTEIYRTLESILDNVEDVADLISGVVLKNS